jgi:hypothetical protein
MNSSDLIISPAFRRIKSQVAKLLGISKLHEYKAETDRPVADAENNSKGPSIDADQGTAKRVALRDVINIPKRNTSNTRIKVFVQFTDPAHAFQALQLDRTHTRLGIYLAAEHIINIQVFIVSEVFDIFAADISRLEENGVKISSSLRPGRKLRKITISSSNLERINTVKAKMIPWISGYIVLNSEGTALWDNFFVSTDGETALTSLCRGGNYFIYCDRRKHTITIYCLDGQYEALHQQVLELYKYKVILQQPLKHDLDQKLTKLRLTHIQTILNTLKIDIDTSQTPPLLLYSGSLEHVRTLETWL